MQSWDAPTHAKAVRLPAKLCGVLNEADLVAQLRPPEAGVLRGPPLTSLFLGPPRSPSHVSFSAASEFTFLSGSRGKELGGFPGMPNAHRLLSSV